VPTASPAGLAGVGRVLAPHARLALPGLLLRAQLELSYSGQISGG